MAKKIWLVLFAGVLFLGLSGFGCSGGDPVEPLPDEQGYDLPEARNSDNQPRELLGLCLPTTCLQL